MYWVGLGWNGLNLLGFFQFAQQSSQRILCLTSLYRVPHAPSPGFFEEVLFRGVIQQGLSAVIGGIPALVVTSVLFGLAHSPVPGASSFTEACYGANFGLLYMVSSGREMR